MQGGWPELGLEQTKVTEGFVGWENILADGSGLISVLEGQFGCSHVTLGMHMLHFGVLAIFMIGSPFQKVPCSKMLGVSWSCIWDLCTSLAQH